MKQASSIKNFVKQTPSIFRKMFLSFVIVPIIPIIALLYLANNAQEEGQAFAELKLVDSAKLIGANIDKWVERNVYVSSLVSQFDDVVSMNVDAQKPILRKVKENSAAITAVRIDNAEGWAIARSDEKTLKNYADRIYFTDVKGGKSIGQQVIFGRTQNKPLLCFTVPINDEGAFVGALSQCAGLDDISNNVTDLQLGATGFAFLVDRTNQLVAYGGTDKNLTGQLEDMSQHPAIQATDANKPFTYEIEGSRKVAYKASVGLDWTLVVQQDYNEAFAEPLAIRNNAIVTILITALASLVIIYLMSRSISRPLDEARQENANILGAVNDGLFLIDQDYTIGKQQSANLPEILQKEGLAGTSFARYLSDAVPLDVAELAKDYIDLLFTPRVKEDLVQTRNPLKLVQTSVENASGQLESRYLSLTFKRVQSDNSISNLLVTAKDVTKETLLQAELEKVKEEKSQQVNLLAEILYIPSDSLRKFLASTDIALNKINDILEKPGSDPTTYRSKVNTIFEIIHKVKGDASAIDFELFAGECHRFEEVLTKMRQQTADLTGNEFLPVTLALDELFKSAHVIHVLLDKISTFGDIPVGEKQTLPTMDAVTEESVDNDWQQLREMAKRLAEKYEKDVEVHFQGFKLELPDDYHEALKDITTQLIRNTMVHGIEERYIRQQREKVKEGQITVSVKQHAQQGYVFVYKDDGEGVDYSAVRNKLVDNGLYTETEAMALTEKALLKMVFDHGFSMAGEANMDAGRGVGLPLVIDTVKSLNGKINVSSHFGKGFILKVTLPEKVAPQSVSVN